MTVFKAGLIQTNVSNEMAENVAFVREQARLARDAGADFITTPENTGLIGANKADTLAKAQTEETHGMLAAARASRTKRRSPFAHGAIAPSASDFVSSGMMSRGSKSYVAPRPWHDGHAPWGELNEKARGDISGIERPHDTQASRREKS